MNSKADAILLFFYEYWENKGLGREKGSDDCRKIQQRFILADSF
jgi:hypothetical protein